MTGRAIPNREADVEFENQPPGGRSRGTLERQRGNPVGMDAEPGKSARHPAAPSPSADATRNRVQPDPGDPPELAAAADGYEKALHDVLVTLRAIAPGNPSVRLNTVLDRVRKMLL